MLLALKVVKTDPDKVTRFLRVTNYDRHGILQCMLTFRRKVAKFLEAFNGRVCELYLFF